MEETKYYFISFMYGDGLTHKIENSALEGEHPMEWQIYIDKVKPNMFKLISWQEIDKDLYDKFLK